MDYSEGVVSNDHSGYKERKVVAGDTAEGDWFGHAVAISGDWAFVGLVDPESGDPEDLRLTITNADVETTRFFDRTVDGFTWTDNDPDESFDVLRDEFIRVSF